MKTLILTEKPSVAMDFAAALKVKGKKDGYIENSGYIITWAVGHLVELLEPEDYNPKWKSWRLDTLPILPGRFEYKPLPKTRKQLNIIHRLLKKPLNQVIIATDAGREGEVIARTILLTSRFSASDKLKRFWTSQALTPQVVRQSMNQMQPAARFDRLWRAGQSRQIADWLVGMNGTRAATKKLNDLFSVGRVQTAVLALLVDRRRERENFKPEPYWLVRALFENEKGEWIGTWFNKKQTRILKEEDAAALTAKVNGKTGTVQSVKRQKKKQPPPLLYSLTDLQRDANKRFGLTAKTTLGIAQKLYESHKCLSYPRTDSRVLGSKNVDMARKLVSALSDAYPVIFAGVKHDLIRGSNRRVFNDAKLTDHHALIPLAPVPAKASATEKKIYDMVLRRFAAAFYPDCEYEQTEIITEAEKEIFRTKGKRPLVPGWQDVYKDINSKKRKPPKKDQADEPEQEHLPPLEKNDPAHVKDMKADKKMTQPPPEYSEALLLKDMTNPGRYVDENVLKKIYRGDVGLGTQATRAQIIETLITRKYLVREKKRLMATDKGRRLIDVLRRYPQGRLLTSPEETARWEMQLEDIAQGRGSEEEFLLQIKEMVTKMVEEFKTGRQGLGPCPVCGGEIIKGKRDFGCGNWRKADGGCRFVIRSEMFGKKISAQVISTLLQEKQAGPFAGFMEESGAVFNGLLQLIQGDGGWQVQVVPTQEAVQPEPGASEKIGDCPACGGDVVDKPKGYGCANWREEDGGCQFIIWKEVAKKLITPKMAKELLEKGKIGPLENFISRKGAPFSASLKLVQEEEKWQAKFDFDDGNASGGSTGEVIGRCPACSGDVTEGPRAYGCANWKEEDGGCKFVIWKTVAQKEITKSVAKQLLEKGITDILFGFISRKGSAFSAQLKLSGADGDVPKVVFEFPDG